MQPQPPPQVSPDGRWIWNGAQWVPNTGQAAPFAAPLVRPYESAGFRAMFVTIFVAITAGAVLLGLGLDFAYIGAGGNLDSLDAGTSVLVGLLALVFLIVYFGGFIPAVVMFCMWLHRVVRNMPALGSPDPRWTPGGAVGRCFIPFLNLVHPLFGTLDAWRGSDPAHRWMNLDARRIAGTPALIVFWWASWLIGGWISNIGARMTNSNDSGTVVAGAWIDILGSLIFVAASVLAILVVRGLTARQDRKYQMIATGALS